VSAAVLSAAANAAETPMANTFKTGTTLTEGDALMPGSFRFESEPWTPFYMAGEIIRESRKASGKQSKYASKGNMAHSDKVIDDYDHPCDEMKLQMKINSETQVIEEAEFKTFGSGSAIASSSLTTERVKGKTSRKHWPSRTRISSANSAFPRATLLDSTGYSGIGGRLHLAGCPIL
jgi:hypothetical protein